MNRSGDDDGWIHVPVKKHNYRKKPTNQRKNKREMNPNEYNQGSSNNENINEESLSVADLTQEIVIGKELLKETEFYRHMIDDCFGPALDDLLANHQNANKHEHSTGLENKDITETQNNIVDNKYYHSTIDIVCYGVGNFSVLKSAAMVQLVTALCIHDNLLQQNYKSEICYYEPLITTVESNVLQNLNVKVLEENEQGKRCVKHTVTFFFMPHCPFWLYSNVLWSNWLNLENIILFGNNLSSYDRPDLRSIKRIENCVIPLLSRTKKWKVLMNKQTTTCWQDKEYRLNKLEKAFNDSVFTVIHPSYHHDAGNSPLPERPPEYISITSDHSDML